ncbi:MAG: DUF1801 domain-containing protein [Chitinophagaceae bacterium]|nr:MAG: DUF1801 domain-containing protein [Chitinophagaceae bacterium]
MEKENPVESYLSNIPIDKKQAVTILREIIKKNLPSGFEEVLSYGAIGYVVPHSSYPAGYHCSPELPLPFINLAAKKNFVVLHHMGLYADQKLLEWFTTAYSKSSSYKIDMGKGCVRFKTLAHIPQQLIAELLKKMTPQDWIALYEQQLKKGT